ncbi:Alcohol dehydrogenase zinc-binding domain protein [Burkholderia sp. H160]|nr:Alcohol dehydrogenase zinc-binding domain protein [Burkholderia sp. H160]
MAERWAPGTVLGFETAGTVVRRAADGSGPDVGSRVAGFAAAGGWAQRRALDTTQLAIVPDAYDLATAAALPVAGVTVLRAIRTLGSVLARRILVTGAGGGVGRMAVQLAALAGAHVVAVVSTEARAKGLEAAGAHEIVVGDTPLPPFDHVLDNVGGEMLARCYELLPADGTLVSIGAAGGAVTMLDFEQARVRRAGRIQPFNVFSGGPLGSDIGTVLHLAADGAIGAEIGWRGDWTRIAEAIDAFRQRKVVGKALLDIS